MCSSLFQHNAGIKLQNVMPMIVKMQSETRWSERTESVAPVNKYLEKILQVLQDMKNNENETSETRSNASQQYNPMLNIPTFARILEQSTHSH